MGQQVLLATANQNAGGAANINTPDFTRTGVESSAAHFIINMLAVPTVVTVTPVIQGKDALGNYYDILVGPAIVAVSQVVLKVGRGLTIAANSVANDGLPDTYRVQLRHSAAGVFNYNVCQNDIA